MVNQIIISVAILISTHVAGTNSHFLVVRPYIAEGPSMAPTFQSKSRLSVDTHYYHDHDMKRGDIIVFNVTKEKVYVKRIIALPGETIRVEGNNVYVNGNLLDEPYIKSVAAAASAKGVPYNSRNFTEKMVPNGTIFVMGDNRSNSLDSRDIGFIQNDQIIGKVTVINGEEIE